MWFRVGEIPFLDFNVDRQAGRQDCPSLIGPTGLSEGQRVAITFGTCYLSPSQLTFPLTPSTSKLIIHLQEMWLGYVRQKLQGGRKLIGAGVERVRQDSIQSRRPSLVEREATSWVLKVSILATSFFSSWSGSRNGGLYRSQDLFWELFFRLNFSWPKCESWGVTVFSGSGLSGSEIIGRRVLSCCGVEAGGGTAITECSVCLQKDRC